MRKRIYLAGGLFNAGERLHNLYIEKHLNALGYEIVLPQREAKRFLLNGHFDVSAIVRDCQRWCTDHAVVFVGCIDGADADSGTCVEYGMAVTSTGGAVVYRTDFRTDERSELGVNAMLRGPGSMFVYEPCFFTELEQVDKFYSSLALRIHQAIEALPPMTKGT